MKRLKELRLDMKLRQQDIAEKIGVDRTTYTKYEGGDSEPSNEMILKLADVFAVSTDYLLGLSDDKKPPVSKMDTSGDAALANASAETKKIMELLAQLGPENQQKALDHLDYLLARQDEQGKK